MIDDLFTWRMTMRSFKVMDSSACYFTTAVDDEDDRVVIDVEVEVVDAEANVVRLANVNDRSRSTEVTVASVAEFLGAIDAGWPAQVILDGEEAKLRMISPAAAATIDEAKAEFEKAWGRYMDVRYHGAEGDEEEVSKVAREARARYVSLIDWREGK